MKKAPAGAHRQGLLLWGLERVGDQRLLSGTTSLPLKEAINRAAVAFLAKSEGYLGHSIYASQESPGRVVLQVQWASLEAHTVGFRQSPAFAQWREVIGPFFQSPPNVEHFDDVTAP